MPVLSAHNVAWGNCAWLRICGGWVPGRAGGPQALVWSCDHHSYKLGQNGQPWLKDSWKRLSSLIGEETLKCFFSHWRTTLPVLAAWAQGWESLIESNFKLRLQMIEKLPRDKDVSPGWEMITWQRGMISDNAPPSTTLLRCPRKR